MKKQINDLYNPQSHTINLIFDGTFEDFVLLLEEKGLDFDFVPPGLVNSMGTLVVYRGNSQDE